MRPEILKKIEGSKHTTRTNLVNMQINNDEILEIMQRIKILQPNISVIDLDSNNLGDKGAFILTECLHDFPQIVQLSLQFNCIGEEGAVSLFSLKKDLPDLDILFRGNKIHSVEKMAEIERKALYSGFCRK